MEPRLRSQKRNSAASHQILFRACTDGVQRLEPISENSFSFDICCTQCNHVVEKVNIDKDRFEVEDMPEFANYVRECDKCSHFLRIEVISNFLRSTDGTSNEWEPLFNVDCRECRIDIVYCTAWKIISKKGTEFNWNGNDDFYQYDEAMEYPVGITNLDFYVKQMD